MRLYVILITALAAVLLAACSSAPSSSAQQVVEIDASEFKFSPSTVQVKVGQPVKITLRNRGTVEHDWSIMQMPVSGKTASSGGHEMQGMQQEPAVHVAATNGQNNQIEFTPTVPGTYDFWCTVPGHKEAGMLGQLVVRNP